MFFLHFIFLSCKESALLYNMLIKIFTYEMVHVLKFVYYSHMTLNCTDIVVCCSCKIHM